MISFQCYFIFMCIFKKNTNFLLFFFKSQRLEESVLSEEKKLTVRGPSPDAPPACLPARVREIVTKNLSESRESVPNVTT